MVLPLKAFLNSNISDMERDQLIFNKTAQIKLFTPFVRNLSIFSCLT